jgi:hypothetical protein
MHPNKMAMEWGKMMDLRTLIIKFDF